MTHYTGLRARLRSYLGVDDPPDLVEAQEPDPARPWSVLSLVNDWVRHAETKSAVTLAAAGVSAGVLYNVVKDQHHPPVVLSVLAVACAAFLVGTGVCAVVGVWPRLRTREAPTSLLYFDHIARAYDKPGPYADALRALIDAPGDEMDQVAQQVWANARVARRKYRWAGKALVCLVGAIIFLGATATYIALVSIGVTHG